MKLTSILAALPAVIVTVSAVPVLETRWNDVCAAGYGLVCCAPLRLNCDTSLTTVDECNEANAVLLHCCPVTLIAGATVRDNPRATIPESAH